MRIVVSCCVCDLVGGRICATYHIFASRHVCTYFILWARHNSLADACRACARTTPVTRIHVAVVDSLMVFLKATLSILICDCKSMPSSVSGVFDFQIASAWDFWLLRRPLILFRISEWLSVLSCSRSGTSQKPLRRLRTQGLLFFAFGALFGCQALSFPV